jgi:hypothetical protein
MAKSRKTPGRKTRTRRETGSDLSFIGSAIDDAIATIERRARDLPSAAERRIARSIVLALKLTAKMAQLHCGPFWFIMGR